MLALLREGEILWIGTFGAGLARLDTTKKEIQYFASDAAKPSTLSSDFIGALHQDRTNPELLWVGTTSGLNAFDKRSGSVVRYVHNPAIPASMSHDHVTNIHEDRAGRLWIAT